MLLIPTLVALLTTQALPTTDTSDVPSVFREVPTGEALAVARGEGKLLLLLFTSEDSAACRWADEWLWTDQYLEPLLRQYTLPVKLDIDEHEHLAWAYDVRHTPALLLIRGGEAVKRWAGTSTVHLGSPGDLYAEIHWRYPSADPAWHDVHEQLITQRLAELGPLVLQGRHDEAAQSLLWVWAQDRLQLPDPDDSWPQPGEESDVGVPSHRRATFLQILLENSERAREGIAQWMDMLHEVAQSPVATDTDYRHWLALARLLGRECEVIDWIQANTDGAGRLTGHKGAPLDRLADVLRSAGQVTDAGRLLGNITATVEEALGQKVVTPGRLLSLHADATAAGFRAQEAAICELVVKRFDNAKVRLALVRRALADGLAGPHHVTLLDEARSLAIAEADEREAVRLLAELNDRAKHRPAEGR